MYIYIFFLRKSQQQVEVLRKPDFWILTACVSVKMIKIKADSFNDQASTENFIKLFSYLIFDLLFPI